MEWVLFRDHENMRVCSSLSTPIDPDINILHRVMSLALEAQALGDQALGMRESTVQY
jgi:hypothetical protein